MPQIKLQILPSDIEDTSEDINVNVWLNINSSGDITLNANDGKIGQTMVRICRNGECRKYYLAPKFALQWAEE